MGLSHIGVKPQPGANNGESDRRRIRQEGPLIHLSCNLLLSPKQNAYPTFPKQPSCLRAAVSPQTDRIKQVSRVAGEKKLLPGVVYAEIPLDACKCYPIRAFAGSNPFIVVSDRNTKKENPTLTVKLEPGCKTAPYPQVAFYIKGDYHTENILYPRSNPREWATWIEFYADKKQLEEIIDTLIRVKLGMEGIKT
jgi:hypothetical protein